MDLVRKLRRLFFLCLLENSLHWPVDARHNLPADFTEWTPKFLSLMLNKEA